MDNKTKKNFPDHPSHTPLIKADYNDYDAKYLTIGKSTWSGGHDISAKIWRYGNEKWSRQSEEIPLRRVLDLATLVVATIKGKSSYLNETPLVKEDSEEFMAIQEYIDENMEILAPRLNALAEVLKPSSGDFIKEQQPNIFSFATSELSQDAMFAWIIAWADKSRTSVDPKLNDLGKSFLRLLMNKDQNYPIESVTVGRQWKNIDVWVEVNDDLFLIIEDKTGTSIHDNQLDRYKHSADEKYKGKRETIVSYVKTGNEPGSILRKIRRSGYITISRKDIIDCLKFHKVDNQIVQDYLNHLQAIEDDTWSFKNLPVSKWSWNARQGFYMELESLLGEGSWSYVANASGGFLGFWWNFVKIDGTDLYLQIEKDRLCFKIHCKDNQQNTRDSLSKIIMDKKRARGCEEVQSPIKRGVGSTMTVAFVDFKDIFGEDRPDMDSILEKLHRYEAIVNDCTK